MTSPDRMRADELTQQGIDALKAGQTARARVLLARALRIDTENERAWLWLSGAVESVEDRRHCLRRALTINPRNAAARAGLAQLDAAHAPPPIAPPSSQDVPRASALPQPIPTEQSPLHAPTLEVPPALPEPAPPPPAPLPASPPAPDLSIPKGARPVLVMPRPADHAYLPGIVYDLVLLGIAALIWWLSGISSAPPVAHLATPSAPPVTSSPAPSLSPSSTASATTTSPPARAQIVIEDRGTTIAFPDRLTFSARVASIEGLDRIVLEYGVKKLTCGSVVARAFPAFKPGLSANVQWTWEMRQSGSEPPGATLWYRWRVIAKAGDERVSEEQQVLWLDNKHTWRSVSRDQLTLHWYDAPPAFAEDLLDAATHAVKDLQQTTGVAAQGPIDLYIYDSSAAMRDAVLYEPGWSGGLAFPAHAVVLLGIEQAQLEWGRRATAHELTHVLVGRRAFGCLGSVPTWLDEGIAVVGQGGPESDWQAQFQAALKANQLVSVRALSGGFSEHADLAGLSYAQSYSLVNYLIGTFGPERLLALFDALRAGTSIDAALNKVYSFGVDGLEDRWRAAVGARARPGRRTVPTPTVAPTPVPTYPPVHAAGG